jgi:transcriptional regulator with XRE-family HTH domain
VRVVKTTPASVAFGKRLRAIRHSAGIRPVDLALAVGRTEQMVYLWERGEVRPSAEILDGIAAFLNCTRDELFDQEDGVHVHAENGS